MKTRIISLAAIGLAMSATAAMAQPPAAAPAPTASVVVANPTYTSIHMEVAVNKSAADTWKAVGAKYCELGTWVRAPCVISAGTDGQIGAVRTIAGRIIEVLVGKTDLSYTYTQPVGRTPYNLYHGTLEAKPVTAKTSKLVYTLFFDNSMLADDAARERDRTAKTTQFTNALNSMKVLAETGAMPPAPAAPARPAAPAAAAPAAK